MKKRLHLLRILMLVPVLFAFQAMAQDLQVSGVVTDAKDGSSLPGVSVLVKGTTLGTATDINGRYSLKTKAGATLVFSFIGYDRTEIAVSQRVHNVALKPTATSLSEVVVIGYGEVKKSDATGSISKISTKDFNRGVINSPQELLMGKSAGVVISNPTGQPGGGSTIRIRGGSSLNASNDPLIIVDGMPIDNSGVSGNGNILSVVNPNDVESFTVLKDASATAIYGSRASNGVIIITTKKGVSGTPMKVTYSGTASLGVAQKFVDVYSGDEIRNIALEHESLYGNSSFEKLGSANTNWQNEIFRTAVSHDHNLSVTGNVVKIPYRASVGYTDQMGILKNTDMNRITGSIGVSPTFLDKSLKVDVNARLMHTNNNFGDAGAVGSAVAMDPSQVVKDGNAASDGYFQWYNYDASLGTANPVEQALVIDNTSKVNRFIGNILLDYSIPVVSGLRAVLNLATDHSSSDGHNNRPTTSPSGLTNSYFGQKNNYDATFTNKLLDFYLNYVKDLPSISSKLDLTGGYSWQRFHHDSHSFTESYTDSTHPYQSSRTNGPQTLQLLSFFGRVNYTFKENYLLTFTLRDDGSSRFSKANRWGLFPSAAFAWKVKNDLLKDVDVLSDLKLRLGWGVTGQQDVGSFYPYMSVYDFSNEGAYYLFDGEYISTLRPATYDPNIKWESTITQNVGLDFGFIKDKLTGSIDLYKRKTNDLLNTVTIPSLSNFSNRMTTNVGNLENKGVEITLNYLPIVKADESLNISGNFTYNVNKITKLLASDDPNYIGVLEGNAFTGQNQVSRVGYAVHSFFVNKQIYDANGNPIEGLYEDLSGKGGSVGGDNNDKYIYHNPDPKFLIGLSCRYTIKSFDFAASTRTSIGNYLYNAVAAGASFDQMYQIGYWHNEPKFLDDTRFIKRQFTSDYFVENASFFKLDNVSVGYTHKFAKNVSARFSFTVQNALTITKYSGLDPEISGGIDNNIYPRPRTYLLGVGLSL